MTIHERIFTLRRAAGLSQETLAERVGVSRQAIGKWENGAALPGLDNLQALAAALGVSCDELLTGESAQKENAGGEDIRRDGMAGEDARRGARGSAAAGDAVRGNAGASFFGDAVAHDPAGSPAAGANVPAGSPVAGATPANRTAGGDGAGDPTAAEPTAAGLRALLEAYQTAQRQAARRQRMLLASLAAVLLALLCLGIFADARLGALAGRVDEVSGRMNGIDQRIDSRIGSIRAEIEESLRESERIVADFDWQYQTLSEDSIELTLTATPKSRREDTAAVFSVVPSDGAAITAGASPQANGGYTARLEIPLAEEYERFAVMAAFTTNGETQSQLLFHEVNFYSGRCTTADLTLTDFRAKVLWPDTEDARLSLGGECGLEIQCASGEGAPVPVSAEVVLLVDGARAAAQTPDLGGVFGAPEQLSGAEAQVPEAAGISGTWYVRFEPLELPLPRTGAVLEATVTDSSGRTVVCRQEVYRP